MSSLSIEDLRVFMAIARNQHITATADELGMAQPTVTRVLQRVEREVGAQLFERRGRTLVINTRGDTLRRAAEAIIARYDATRLDISRLLDPEHGTIRLDFMHSLGTWMVPDLIRDYRRAHPGVHFALHQGPASALIERVHADEADLALVGPQPRGAEAAELHWRQLYRQPLAVACPLGHPLAAAGPEPITMQEVDGQAFIATKLGYGTRQLLDELVAEAGITAPVAFDSMELSTVAGLVSAGLGVALLPMNDPYLTGGTAQQGFILRPLRPACYRELGVVWRTGVELTPAAEQFRRWVLERIPAHGEDPADLGSPGYGV
ncbi:HTH-type transcriptional regulator GltC [Corynebacterium ciconiae DSM 44920]|uniref:LysR family transcriptional regulator n=1 Tax=Corynebacterium ciconiae TaxID=227319 RepID=UPI0003A4785C|nr:LysR family transcriptional regulator [Corynebacterium ciconiae]WKD60196.1 HTH-type transcriptional regulator GltC [Corynebacterium ciconiae DSM 44920]